MKLNDDQKSAIRSGAREIADNANAILMECESAISTSGYIKEKAEKIESWLRIIKGWLEDDNEQIH